jgi:hypothetical protein
MKIAIMQPYFFPYLGYFDLLYNVDLFLVYDNVQYIRRGWIHRNRIFHQSGNGWQYIIVPTKKTNQKTPILDIHIFDESPWRKRLLNQLEHYKNVAPYAELTIGYVEECLKITEPSLSRLNMYILSQFSTLLDLNLQYQFCSDLKMEFKMERNAEERILDICEFVGAKEYVNLPGGVDLYHPEAFQTRNIKLTFRNLPNFVYQTQPYNFEPNLSIIDLLMWNKPQAIKKYLDIYRDQG